MSSVHRDCSVSSAFQSWQGNADVRRHFPTAAGASRKLRQNLIHNHKERGAWACDAVADNTGVEEKIAVLLHQIRCLLGHETGVALRCTSINAAQR
jgi:hypothetical protein